LNNFLKTLGPGILFASTAIGVSHLVQSTQAGANYGFTMLWAILLANLFKYPFFEFGSRYANATGQSIIDGYRKIGRFPFFLYILITLVSMFLVTAAVGFVTSGFMQQLFGIESTLLAVILVFAVCILILISNNFSLLDKLIKIIGIVLLLSTLFAFILVLIKGKQGNLPLNDTSVIDYKAYLLFLIPLMGWMPTAVDLSAWNSLWTVERIKESGYHPTLKETLFDFNLGYILSALLAICFVTLGAFIMFGTPASFSASPVGFSGEVISLYTKTFGDWAYIIIAISAFSIMFGTCVAVFDGYSRAMAAIIRIVKTPAAEKASTQQNNTIYRGVLLVTGIGSFFLIYAFLGDIDGFKSLINLATSISFVMAPIVAIFNYILVTKKYLPESHLPPIWMRVLSILGILFLSLFSIYFLFQENVIDYLLQA